MDMATITEKIEELMAKYHIMGEIVGYYEDSKLITLEVTWGDWKHSHKLLDSLMWEEFEELKKVKEVTTEEDGSDCYTAIHFYYFN